MGFVSNHAIVMARLIIDGKDYGIQAFLVQIRSRETHQPLPGIELGDIGMKLGYNTKDNSYMIMKNIRIPRDNLVKSLFYPLV